MPQTNYEELTVPELKDLADQRGVEVFSDARKAEIISALEASDFLLKPEGKSETELPPPETGEPPPTKPAGERQMSSTVSTEVDAEDFWKLKLHS